MKIDVWSDFVCPFCYIGKRRLEQAVEQFPHKDDVAIEFKSFELDPNAAVYSGKSIHEAIAEKYNIPVEQAKETNAGLAHQAEAVGLTFHFETMKPTNTFHAHRLAKYAKTLGKETILTEKLLHGYFTDSVNLSDIDTLAAIAVDAGLDKASVLKVLQDENAYAKEVRADETLAQQYGVTGVPFFVINNKYAISGAQPLETFTSALEQVWEEENPKPRFKDLSSSKTEFCTGNDCGEIDK
ncbi:DSBA oxidoreductase [Paraliobacillus quinghaiensis]|uniref:DSBA oxidoreductase n=1 Tax=Paraliobacillus quinghaiensis TaxID=470815 RepID=A0A917TJ51_9BACI|nr:DsbA family oxidoreductase [Paraliobacillus quinghaiensis]GGM24334.1 DSBA oxidoreductase [Paraliobacillus quinghaiensis]